MRITRIASAIASLLACSLLAACGGGASGGMVRSSPPPAAPTTPPPLSGSRNGPCPMPLSGDCVLKQPQGVGNAYMYGGRSSDHSLIKQDGWYVDMRDGQYRFAGGTRVEAGLLTVGESAMLISDARVLPGATLEVTGMLTGNATTDPAATDKAGGHLYFAGTVQGNVGNGGTLTVAIHDPAWYSKKPLNRIEGSFQQAASGTLRVFLPYLDYAVPLTINGRADIEGGTLTIAQYESWDPIGPSFFYPLPTTPTTARILHANGGVFGTFDRWTSPGLFIEGSLRYGSHDVWFDLTRVSLAAAMAAQGAGGITLASAGNLDRALAIADSFAAAPTAAQSSFLHSAGRLLWLDDAAQAARSLDSLAGSLHIDAVGALANNDALARGIGARTLALQPGDHAGAWSRLQGGDTIAGFDQWLSPRLLAGATVAQARDAHSDGFGGRSRHDSPQAALYLRWFGNDGWYAGGSAGYAQHALALDRRIDLAGGGRWNAYAHRRLGITSLDAEAGRRFDVGGANIAPYLWLGADVIRSEGAIEQGQTGLELTLQANAQASLDAGLGVRVGKRWRVGETGWLAFDADARYRQRLVQAGDPLRAAFIGVPDAWFDVPGHEARSGTWLDLGLRGGFGHGWAWSVGHAGSLAGQANGRRWQVSLARRF